MILLFSDAPFSLIYRLNESTLAFPLHNPVRLSVDVLAYPSMVSFQWYFKPTETAWELITTSDIYTVSVINGGRTSVLTINEFTVRFSGQYRLDATNGVGPVKQFLYTVKPAGKALLFLAFFSYVTKTQQQEKLNFILMLNTTVS